MKKPSTKLFEDVDAMEIRKRFGGLVDRVRLNSRRYIIHRRGEPTALLVPLTDRELIQKGISGTVEELNAAYDAFDRVCGTIDDPLMHDASQTIDEHIYDEDETMGEHDA